MGEGLFRSPKGPDWGNAKSVAWSERGSAAVGQSVNAPDHPGERPKSGRNGEAWPRRPFWPQTNHRKGQPSPLFASFISGGPCPSGALARLVRMLGGAVAVIG